MLNVGPWRETAVMVEMPAIARRFWLQGRPQAYRLPCG
jgi:hypothetical protein